MMSMLLLFLFGEREGRYLVERRVQPFVVKRRIEFFGVVGYALLMLL